jgi:hypothetical protein
MCTLEKFCEVFRLEQNLEKKIIDYDPIMKCSIRVTRMITEAL